MGRGHRGGPRRPQQPQPPHLTTTVAHHQQRPHQAAHRGWQNASAVVGHHRVLIDPLPLNRCSSRTGAPSRGLQYAAVVEPQQLRGRLVQGLDVQRPVRAKVSRRLAVDAPRHVKPGVVAPQRGEPGVEAVRGDPGIITRRPARCGSTGGRIRCRSGCRVVHRHPAFSRAQRTASTCTTAPGVHSRTVRPATTTDAAPSGPGCLAASSRRPCQAQPGCFAPSGEVSPVVGEVQAQNEPAFRRNSGLVHSISRTEIRTRPSRQRCPRPSPAPVGRLSTWVASVFSASRWPRPSWRTGVAPFPLPRSRSSRSPGR